MLYLFIFSDSWDKSSFYNSDSNLTVFKWCSPNEHFSVEKLGKTLIVEDLAISKICPVQPTGVCHNAVIVVDVDDPMDIRADENGVWRRTGAPVAYVSVHQGSGDKFKIYRQTKMDSLSYHYKISQTYYRHSTSPDFHKMISTAYGKRC